MANGSLRTSLLAFLLGLLSGALVYLDTRRLVVAVVGFIAVWIVAVAMIALLQAPFLTSRPVWLSATVGVVAGVAALRLGTSSRPPLFGHLVGSLAVAAVTFVIALGSIRLVDRRGQGPARRASVRPPE